MKIGKKNISWPQTDSIFGEKGRKREREPYLTSGIWSAKNCRTRCVLGYIPGWGQKRNRCRLWSVFGENEGWRAGATGHDGHTGGDEVVCGQRTHQHLRPAAIWLSLVTVVRRSRDLCWLLAPLLPPPLPIGTSVTLPRLRLHPEVSDKNTVLVGCSEIKTRLKNEKLNICQVMNICDLLITHMREYIANM